MSKIGDVLSELFSNESEKVSVENINDFDKVLKTINDINFNIGDKFSREQKISELKKIYPLVKKSMIILNSNDVQLYDNYEKYQANFLDLLDILDSDGKKYDQDDVENIVNNLKKYNKDLRKELLNQGKLFKN